MSSSIWTECAGTSRIRPFGASPWRVVEAQHLVSTRKLVDSVEEQMLLKDMIESVKPPFAGGERLHVLLRTPFRYPPLRHGSRFATRHERSLWYGSDSIRTACAELAYYRFVFLEGSAAAIDALRLDRLEPGEGEAGCSGQQHEIACLQRHCAMTIDREPTAALEHGGEARLVEARVAHAPSAGAADGLREHRARRKQADDF